MSEVLSVKFHGFDEAMAELKRLAQKEANNLVRRVLRKYAKEMLQDVKATSAFKDRTGRLRASIQMKKISEKGQDGSIGFRIIAARKAGLGGRYAHLIEFGHRQIKKGRITHVPARPFLRPAILGREEEIANEAFKRLRDAVLQGKKTPPDSGGDNG